MQILSTVNHRHRETPPSLTASSNYAWRSYIYMYIGFNDYTDTLLENTERDDSPVAWLVGNYGGVSTESTSFKLVPAKISQATADTVIKYAEIL